MWNIFSYCFLLSVYFLEMSAKAFGSFYNRFFFILLHFKSPFHVWDNHPLHIYSPSLSIISFIDCAFGVVCRNHKAIFMHSEFDRGGREKPSFLVFGN